MEPHRDRWQERLRDKGLNELQRTYAERRASALERPYYQRVAGCRSRGMETSCGCPGTKYRPFGCRQHLTCGWCRAQRSNKLSRKISEALRNRVDATKGQAKRLLVMVTVSLRHTGDIAKDRRELSQAWKRFRLACARRWGHFAFVGTFEVTAGSDGLGHVHMHVICHWPRGAPGDATQGDWELLQRLWVAAATLDGVERSTRVSFRASQSARDAGAYVSKYVAKGVTSAEFGPVLAAKIAAGTYNTRWLVSSRGFWVPFEARCPCCGELVVRDRFSWLRDVGPAPEPKATAPPWKQGRLVGLDECDHRTAGARPSDARRHAGGTRRGSR